MSRHLVRVPQPISVLVVLGTRPEAIKLATVINELRRQRDFITRVCLTGQHREMVQPILELFDVRPDVDLALMTHDQRLSSLTASALTQLDEVIAANPPDWLVIQGDTTTAMAAAMAGFYRRIAIAHVEAGLRTRDLARPFPEEANRRIADAVATLHFAPTKLARQNLLDEGTDESSIHVTGNTVIDALLAASAHPAPTTGPVASLPSDRRIVLLTAHRRESFGSGLREVFAAVRAIADALPDVQIVYPVHLNPNVKEPASAMLAGHERISLIPPLDYLSLVHLMRRSTLILTDSGGIQEEAPAFGKPVLVLREVTERPEAVEAGCARIVGTDREVILSAALELLTDQAAYLRMAQVANPFGDGRASGRIVKLLRAKHQGRIEPPAEAAAHHPRRLGEAVIAS